MDLGRPQSAVCPTLEGDVLVVLAGTKRALTGRDVARLARRGSQRGVLAALDRLVLQGTVHRSEAGRSHLFALNWDHVAAPAVQVLAGLRAELIERIRTQVAHWEIRPLHVSLFGSLARAEGDVESDVDVLVVRPDEIDEEDREWRGQLDRLSDLIPRWSGNRASIAELTASDLARRREAPPAIFTSLREESITLAGPDISQVLEEAE